MPHSGLWVRLPGRDCGIPDVDTGRARGTRRASGSSLTCRWWGNRPTRTQRPAMPSSRHIKATGPTEQVSPLSGTAREQEQKLRGLGRNSPWSPKGPGMPTRQVDGRRRRFDRRRLDAPRLRPPRSSPTPRRGESRVRGGGGARHSHRPPPGTRTRECRGPIPMISPDSMADLEAEAAPAQSPTLERSPTW